MLKSTLIAIPLMFLIAGSVQAHEDPLQVPWPDGEKVPCRCDILAMDYELCLKGIGREECFEPVVELEPKCSDRVAEGTVVQTFPPTFSCKDLLIDTPDQLRIRALELRLKEIEIIIWKLFNDRQTK